jgi:hypothetical protein
MDDDGIHEQKRMTVGFLSFATTINAELAEPAETLDARRNAATLARSSRVNDWLCLHWSFTRA